MIKEILKNIMIFTAAFVICTGALLLVCRIPQSAIHDNSLASSEYFTDNAGFPTVIKGHANTRMDNYADCVLFNVIYNVDEKQTFRSAIAAPYYRIEGNDAREDYASAVVEGKEPNNEYSRYWHGSQVLIRPLLLVASVEQIRLILFAALAILNIVLAALLLRRRQYAPAAIYFAALILVQFWVSAFTIEYVMSFLVMTAACIAVTVIWCKGADSEPAGAREAQQGPGGVRVCDRRMTYVFIVSGLTTCFLDFLTAETLTFTVPFILYLMLRRQGGNAASPAGRGLGETSSPGRLPESFSVWAKRLVKWGLAWLVSYAAMFAIKWALVYGVAGRSAFLNALESAVYRMEGAVALDGDMAGAGEVLSAGQGAVIGILRNIACLLPASDRLTAGAIAGIALGIVALLAALLYLFRGERVDGAFIGILLLVAAIPYLRYLCLSNHAFIHYFFTYRAQMAVLMALMAIMAYNLKPSYVLGRGGAAGKEAGRGRAGAGRAAGKDRDRDRAGAGRAAGSGRAAKTGKTAKRKKR